MVEILIPETRLEFGGSFQHSLEQGHSNSYGFHAVWEPIALPLEIRAEYARSFQGSGYWVRPPIALVSFLTWKES